MNGRTTGTYILAQRLLQAVQDAAGGGGGGAAAAVGGVMNLSTSLTTLT